MSAVGGEAAHGKSVGHESACTKLARLRRVVAWTRWNDVGTGQDFHAKGHSTRAHVLSLGTCEPNMALLLKRARANRKMASLDLYAFTRLLNHPSALAGCASTCS